MKKVRAEKKQKVDCAVIQGSPHMTAASKKPERRPRGMQAAAAGSTGCLPLTSDPLGREPPLLASQELLAAAVANYTHSVKTWGFESPPLPPPPPQSSPVERPLSGLYHLLPLGDLARHMDAGQASDSTHVPIQ